MDYMKDGKKRTGFHPVQDLAGDPKGQELAKKVARGARLRIALGKMTDDKDLIQGFMRIWNGERPENVKASNLLDFFWNLPKTESKGLQVASRVPFPESMTEEEKVLINELKRLIVG